jgi:hypothetical protein
LWEELTFLAGFIWFCFFQTLGLFNDEEIIYYNGFGHNLEKPDWGIVGHEYSNQHLHEGDYTNEPSFISRQFLTSELSGKLEF